MIASRTVLGATLGVLLATTAASAQIPRSRVYSRPALPSAEALRRLNLQMAWRTYVPMDGRKDSIIRAELNGRDLFVLTRSGEVIRFDQETGEQKWRARVGKPYTLSPYFAANSRSVYVGANATIFALDRARGTPKWDYPLPGGISASPVVDEEQIYIPGATSRLYTFYLPFVRGSESAGKGLSASRVYVRREVGEEARPRPVWDEQTNIALLFKPLQTDNVVFVISPDGKAIGYSKVLLEGARGTELYRFSTEGKIRVPQSQFGEYGYVGSDDAALYSINLNNGKLHWRHTTGTAIIRQPIALDKDVYVTSEREGMARIDRESGDSLWRIVRGGEVSPANADADGFRAANERFVYATDYSGRILVLDRKRGTRLSMLDTSAYRVPVVNPITDRLYLAANDGLIVCLHDRDQIKPIRHRLALEEAASSVTKLLEQKVTVPGLKEMTLRNVLAEFRLNYKLRFVVVEEAFKEAGLANIQDKLITVPRVENRTVRDLLKATLELANATFQVVDESILIVPLPPKIAPK
jgi:outer membrane protein assembly factor BamB